MRLDQEFLDDAPVDEMFLDDPLEDWRIAGGIPRAFGIDDGDRTAFADPQAIGFGPQDAALLRQAELLQAALEELPRREPALLLAAFRGGLVAAEKNVAPRDRDADAVRDVALRIRRRTHSDPIRGRAHSAAPCSRRAP